MSRVRNGLSYVATIGHRGFTAGTNLLLTIVAGRVLDATEFGVLSLMMAAIGLLMLIHSTLFSEPMLVFGPRDYHSGLRRYIFLLAGSQLAAGLLLAAAISLVWLCTFGLEYLALALVVPLALTLDFQDRTFFMQLKPQVPLLSAITQFAVLVVLLLLGQGREAADVSTFLFLLAASLAAANLTGIVAQARGWSRLGGDSLEPLKIAYRHMRFASWSMASHLLLFLVTNFYIFALPLLQDLSTTAIFRAQSAITGPGAQAFSALGLIAVPMLRMAPNRAAFLFQLKRLILLITLSGGVFAVVIGLWGAQIIGAAYAENYSLTTLGYWLAGLYPLTLGYAFMLGSALRAVDRADLLVRASGLSVMLTLAPGLFLAWRFGVEGVIVAQVFGSLAMAAGCARLLRRCFDDNFDEAN